MRIKDAAFNAAGLDRLMVRLRRPNAKKQAFMEVGWTECRSTPSISPVSQGVTSYQGHKWLQNVGI